MDPLARFGSCLDMQYCEEVVVTLDQTFIGLLVRMGSILEKSENTIYEIVNKKRGEFRDVSATYGLVGE